MSALECSRSPGGAAEYRQGWNPCESRRNESPGGATEYPTFTVMRTCLDDWCSPSDDWCSPSDDWCSPSASVAPPGLLWVDCFYRGVAPACILSPLRGYCGWIVFTGAMPLPVFCRPSGAYTFIIIVPNYSLKWLSAIRRQGTLKASTLNSRRSERPADRTVGGTSTLKGSPTHGKDALEHDQYGATPSGSLSPRTCYPQVVPTYGY